MSDQLSTDLQSLRINRGDPAPRGRGFLIFVMVLVGLGGAGYAIKTYAMPYASASLFKQEVTFTEVSMVSPSQGQVDLTTTGYVVPQSIAKIGAKVVGRVQKANVKEWQEVKNGQILFILDGTDQRAAIASAKARTMAARARAQAAHAQVSEVRLQWEREKRLAANGAVSASTAEDLGARVKALNETANAGDAEANAVAAEVATLQSNLKELTVLSPIDGTASTKPVEVGDVVRPDQTLVEISDLSTLMVEADVAEARISLVKVGAPCEIVLDAFSSKRYRGEVVEVSPVLDRAKASAKVKVKFVDQAENVRGQMSVRVSFLAKEQTAEQLKEAPKKVIPAGAVVDREGSKVTFVVTDDKDHMTKVTLGPPMAGGFELLEGPPSGARLVKDPAPTLADGQPVKEASAK
jgi:RND family efflux transporter MFP subunit